MYNIFRFRFKLYILLAESFQEIVLRELAEIRSDIRELFSRHNSNLSENLERVEFPVPLPMKSIEEFDLLESWITDSNNKQKLVSLLFC